MKSTDLILLTGAAGFIGSCMIRFLNERGFENIIIVDDFSREDKISNYSGKKFTHKIERDALFGWLYKEDPSINVIFHLGARTDTTEFDYSIHERLNVEYSKQLWKYAAGKKIPFIYASSAATYGSGELGYKDDHEIIYRLKPLNPYGVSKNEFDKWVLTQKEHPPFWSGLKFFNVYGPNEYHKGRMASVVFHAFNQIKSTGQVKLFRSHKKEYKDGEQLRDFIFVDDVLNICTWLWENQPASGLYNVGTGSARTFNDLVKAVFKASGKPINIEYIDTPEDIREKYQYFTEADMNKLRQAGYKNKFTSLEEGVGKYVSEFLLKKNITD